MRKIVSIAENSKTSKEKSVQFSAEVDIDEIRRIDRQNYKIVISALKVAADIQLDRAERIRRLKESTGLIGNLFEESSYGYKKLMAKCYVHIVIFSPLGDERERLSALAGSLDPTDEIYDLR